MTAEDEEMEPVTAPCTGISAAIEAGGVFPRFATGRVFSSTGPFQTRFGSGRGRAAAVRVPPYGSAGATFGSDERVTGAAMLEPPFWVRLARATPLDAVVEFAIIVAEAFETLFVGCPANDRPTSGAFDARSVPSESGIPTATQRFQLVWSVFKSSKP